MNLVNTKDVVADLEDQDRTRWDQREIEEGTRGLETALRRGQAGPYQPSPWPAPTPSAATSPASSPRPLAPGSPAPGNRSHIPPGTGVFGV